MLGEVSKPAWATAYPKLLPTYILAGDMDPVGNYGKGPTAVYERLKCAGASRVTLKLYPGARHELHNETIREEFFADIVTWIEANKLCR